MLKNLNLFWTQSLRRQLMLSIALVHAVIMTIFIVDLVNRQSSFLYKQSISNTLSLSQTLASNSVSWVLANDIIGIEEVVDSQKQFPDLLYAMILSPDGRVLGHSDRSKVGLYIKDTESCTLLDAQATPQYLVNNDALIDISSPILVNDRLIGWARVGISQEKIHNGLAVIVRDGLWYTIFAILVGLVIAFFMARGITADLQHLIVVANQIRRGNDDIRISLERKDELGQVGITLNNMLDTISNEKDMNRMIQQELIVAKDNAESANQTKSIFLANMSHELRTPLNAILGYTQIFKKDPSLSPQQLGGIQTIHNSGNHLLLLINDILDLSKVESGRMELVPVEFHFPEFLQNVVNIIDIKVAHKKIKFIYEADQDLPIMIKADDLRLRQVLLNLLSNAIKFTQYGQCTLRVNSEDIGTATALLSIVVEDTGVGISKDMQKKVFEPFQQTGNRLQYAEGSGLGLAISSNLVQLMGGKLHLMSPINDHPSQSEGPGSRVSFTITVPVLADAKVSSDNHVLAKPVNKETPLVIPPRDILEKLSQLLSSGDIDKVINQTQRLATLDAGKYHHFARHIEQMATEFQITQLETFINKHTEN